MLTSADAFRVIRRWTQVLQGFFVVDVLCPRPHCTTTTTGNSEQEQSQTTIRQDHEPLEQRSFRRLFSSFSSQNQPIKTVNKKTPEDAKTADVEEKEFRENENDDLCHWKTGGSEETTALRVTNGGRWPAGLDEHCGIAGLSEQR